jgi:hypothetical protein
MSAPNICPPPPDYYSDADLLKKMDGGVASDSLVPDEASGRVSAAAIASHVQTLQGAGIIKPRPMRTIAGGAQETDTDALKAADAQLHTKLRQEYCYYEQRYRYALKNFLFKATSRNANDNPEAQRLLRDTKTLNIRLNSVLEVMNYVGNVVNLFVIWMMHFFCHLYLWKFLLWKNLFKLLFVQL